MASQRGEETEEALRRLRTHAPTVLHNFLAALMIWLFGILVFIPTASLIDPRASLFCSLIVFIAFTIFVARALSAFKKTVDAFSIFPARKFSSRLGTSQEDSITFFRHILYIIFSLTLYLFYFPILVSLHPAISGIVLILFLVLVFFLSLKIFSILVPKFLEWLV